jgi:pilus assembly protein CpaE
MIHPQFLAFVTESKSHPAIEAVIKANGWPESALHHGGIDEAIAYLKDNKSPDYLLVEVASAAEATEALDKLADVCGAHTKVVVTSNVDEFRFYSWLKDIGIYEYLLHPITEDALKQILSWQKEQPAHHAVATASRQPQVIAIIGARGGVGATSLLCNLAHIISDERREKVTILDMDVHFGSVAMQFNVEATTGLTELFAHPDRIDALFLERVMNKYNDNLGLLSAEAAMSNDPNGDVAKAVPALLRELRSANDITLIDVPRTMNKATRAVLEGADHVVVVSDLSPLGLRDAIRLRDVVVDVLKKPEPMVVVSQSGLHKHEVKAADFAKYYGHELAANIPYLDEAHLAAATGDLLYNSTKNENYKVQLNLLVNRFSDAEPVVKAKEKFLSKIMQKIGK